MLCVCNSTRRPTAVAWSPKLPRIVVAFIVLSGICNRLPADDGIDFNRDIRPLLSDRCFACHGPDAEHRKADFRIDDPAAATDWAIVPGDAAASEVIARITSDDADLVMPPPELNKPLTEQEIDLLTRWVDAGAEY